MRKKKRYQFKKAFIKSIERRTMDKMIALTNKDYLSECLNIEPLKERDQLFVESENMSDSFLNRSKNNNEIVMPNAYINTALWLLDLIKLSHDNLVKDGYIISALFCFRHYLELIMKDSIHYFKLNRGEISSKETGYKEEKHRLIKLWNTLNTYLDSQDEVEIVRKLIIELDKLDEGSIFFRYAFNQTKDGKIVEYDFPAMIIDISKLKKRMLQLYRFFEGVNIASRI